MEKFRKLGLSEPLLQLLGKANITLPSEIQEKVIPLILQGKDVIGGSATGSGKTIAFGAGIIDKTERAKGAQVLILVPTRELADQVGNVFIKYSGYKNLNVSVVYGGVGMSQQVHSLRSAEIIVGTPGRILDHLERGTINLTRIKVLVLDEADRMLDMGFIHDVEKIIRNCPKDRQTLLFSATISAGVGHLASKYMNNPETISVESYVSTEQLKQIYYDVSKELKFSALVHLLKNEKHGLVMVFCNTRHNADFIGRNLKNLSVDVLVIHGGLTQPKRNSIMEQFSSSKKVHVLVCTDIAARGLDIKGVSHVYNYDIPKTSQDYIHRIGRTARAGKDGIAINIISDRDYENFEHVLRDSTLHIERKELPEIERVRIILKEPQGFGRGRSDSPMRGQVRERWNSDNWQARKENRERHDSSRRGQIGERHDNRPRGHRTGRSYGKPAYSRDSDERPSYGNRPQRSFSGGGRRDSGSSGGARRFSNRPGNSGPRKFGSRESQGGYRGGRSSERRESYSGQKRGFSRGGRR